MADQKRTDTGCRQETYQVRWPIRTDDERERERERERESDDDNYDDCTRIIK